VVAKTLTAQTSLVRQLQARTVKREYLALVQGEVSRDGTVEAPIGRHPVARTKMAVVTSGKPAVTHYQVLEQLSGVTLLRCRLETGRTHQIRVHMLSIGHPLVGDPVYGKKTAGKALPEAARHFPRQALHAQRLELVHPQSGELVAWQAAMPEDMQQLLETLRTPDAQDKPKTHALPR
jgi:23S rRNA pseudouridine1911/1915/1917 synthase